MRCRVRRLPARHRFRRTAGPPPAEQHGAAGIHRSNPVIQFVPGVGIDHRPDMRCRIARITQFELARRACNHVQYAISHIVLNAQEPQRRTALAGGAECRRHDVIGDLLGQCRGIDDHGIDAAGLGDQRRNWPIFRRQCAIDRTANFRRPGEDDAGHAAVGHQHGADFSVARHEMQRARRYACRMHQLHRLTGNERCLLGGLGNDAVAGCERAGDLAGKNRQREIPRADANEDATAAISQLIALTGRARQELWHQCAASLAGVVAAIIRRLAHFRNAIVERLAAFDLQQRDQPAAVLLDEIAGAFKRRRTIRDRPFAPRRKCDQRRSERG